MRRHAAGWRFVLGEVAITTIGILIAVAVNAWWENRQDRRTELEALREMRVVLVGVVAGLAGALLVTRLMTNVVYGVRVTDPLTYGAVALLLTVVALAASYIPARRATRIDPLTAMRAD